MRKTIFHGWAIVTKDGTKVMCSNDVEGDFIGNVSDTENMTEPLLFVARKDADQFLKDIVRLVSEYGNEEWKVVPFESNIQI